MIAIVWVRVRAQKQESAIGKRGKKKEKRWKALHQHAINSMHLKEEEKFVWHFEHARQLFECDKSEIVHRVKCTMYITQTQRRVSKWKSDHVACKRVSFFFAFSPSHAVHVLLLPLFCCCCYCCCPLSLLLLLLFPYVRHAHSKYNLEPFTQFLSASINFPQLKLIRFRQYSITHSKYQREQTRKMGKQTIRNNDEWMWKKQWAERAASGFFLLSSRNVWTDDFHLCVHGDFLTAQNRQFFGMNKWMKKKTQLSGCFQQLIKRKSRRT